MTVKQETPALRRRFLKHTAVGAAGTAALAAPMVSKAQTVAPSSSMRPSSITSRCQ